MGCITPNRSFVHTCILACVQGFTTHLHAPAHNTSCRLDYEKREEVLKDVVRALNRCRMLQNCRVVPYGSFVSGFYNAARWGCIWGMHALHVAAMCTHNTLIGLCMHVRVLACLRWPRWLKAHILICAAPVQ